MGRGKAGVRNPRPWASCGDKGRPVRWGRVARVGREKGPWTEMTTVPDLMDMSHRHILFSLLLDLKTPRLVPVSAPNPVRSRLSPACDMAQPDSALRPSVPACVWVRLWAWVRGGCQGYKPGLLLGCRGTWILLLGRHSYMKGNSHGPQGRDPRRPEGKATFFLYKPVC